MINQEWPAQPFFFFMFLLLVFLTVLVFFSFFLMASYLIVCYFPCELEHILVHINLVLSFISQQQCYANLVPNQEALSDLSWKVKQKLALTKQTNIKTVSKTTLELNLWLTCVYSMCVCACFRF